MGHLSLYLMLSLLWSFFTLGSFQLQSSQLLVLLQLRKHLEYPSQLEVWSNKDMDVCYSSGSTSMNVTCSMNAVTELRIMGDKPSRIGYFDGYAIPNQTLSENFSMDSFVATLARLTSLRVLSLVSLGIYGSLPNKIHRLSSLEYLDLSSNFFYGSIPPRIASMMEIKTLILDGNFFNDTVPDWFCSLSNLTVLSLMDNRLKGPLPSSIRRIGTLTSLALSNNEITGELPDLSSLSSLRVLNLSGNKLDSKLPNLPNGLVMTLLSNNSINGEIPKELGNLGHLQNLDLSFNYLKGMPPTTLFSLPNISYLNLASNMLSGSLPYQMACGQKLSFVDISNNRLMGGLPNCLSKRVAKFSGNCLTVDMQHQHPGSYCNGVHVERNNSNAKGILMLIGVIGGVVFVMALLAFGFFMMCQRYCSREPSEQHLLHKQVQEGSVTGVTSELLANARFISQAVKSGTQGIPMCRVFSIEELKEATNNFDRSAILGEGSRGKIYKGKLQNGVPVAIRCLSLSNKFTIRNLKLRLDLLAKLRHPHLVCLLGHCIESNGEGKIDSDMNNAFLIYEYMPNGNLRSHLSDSDLVKGLKWPERLVILIDIAKAVHFLHTGIITGFFNNQLKTSNILLDEHRRAKLSDYGLSIVADDNDKHGERGNDPNSWQMKILEDDIYGFGFILLESILGPSGLPRKQTYLLNEMAALSSQDGRRRLVDPVVLSTSSPESLSVAISIADKCISSDPSSRPSFEDVLWNLQYAAQVQSTGDSDQRFNCSPANS
ncbi:hypothetical protein Nepgr_003001 [Nepenthes gracilis]|uniref:Protein kinase domain-containing protein n=1 Tax=Nepenthes gracilis TaxID=150966 RepID=A0AAD3RYQ7_NEPGR|nr:hypothetical protein Nepgr_003001 [Nepenthes gracilis]